MLYHHLGCQLGIFRIEGTKLFKVNLSHQLNPKGVIVAIQLNSIISNADWSQLPSYRQLEHFCFGVTEDTDETGSVIVINLEVTASSLNVFFLWMTSGHESDSSIEVPFITCGAFYISHSGMLSLLQPSNTSPFSYSYHHKALSLKLLKSHLSTWEITSDHPCTDKHESLRVEEVRIAGLLVG
ncbi:hypothetical protein Tco_1217850 [Tanacetum coccineum]